MISDKEKAQLMFKLAKRKRGLCGGKYDRLEHFKRFDIKRAVKELSKIGWVIVHKKPNFTGLSLNPEHKKEIIEFIEKEMPYIRGMIK